jgi:hypothetical protein
MVDFFKNGMCGKTEKSMNCRKERKKIVAFVVSFLKLQIENPTRIKPTVNQGNLQYIQSIEI